MTSTKCTFVYLIYPPPPPTPPKKSQHAKKYPAVLAKHEMHLIGLKYEHEPLSQSNCFTADYGDATHDILMLLYFTRVDQVWE